MLRQNPDSHQKMRRRYFDSFFPHGQSQLDSILSILYLASRLTLTFDTAPPTPIAQLYPLRMKTPSQLDRWCLPVEQLPFLLLNTS